MSRLSLACYINIREQGTNWTKSLKIFSVIFEDSLDASVVPDTRHSDFLMRLYFGEYESDTALQAMIQQQIGWLGMQIDKLQLRLKEWPNMTKTQHLSFSVGIAEYEAQIKTLKAYLQTDEPKGNDSEHR